MSSAYDVGAVKDLSTLIADKLVELILDGELPPGERLVQTDLASRFGVSRVAIRDALLKLRSRGLSVNVPLRGDIVRPVTRKSVADVFAVRRLLEPHAVTRAVARMDDAARAECRRYAEEEARLAAQGDFSAAVAADWEFHRAIFRHADNEELTDIIEELWRRIWQARSIARRDSEWGQLWSGRSVSRHEVLLDAIDRKASAEAAHITAVNIDESEQELLERLAKLEWE